MYGILFSDLITNEHLNGLLIGLSGKIYRQSRIIKQKRWWINISYRTDLDKGMHLIISAMWIVHLFMIVYLQLSSLIYHVSLGQQTKWSSWDYSVYHHSSLKVLLFALINNNWSEVISERLAISRISKITWTTLN